jgi:hypothetical protein
MELSTYASGYKRLYATDEKELAACLGENARARGGGIGTIDPSDSTLHWWPSSVDFAAEAKRRPPAYGVRDFRELVDVIRRHKNLTRVYWYGHGAAAELQFGGGVRLTEGELAMVSNKDVSGNFAPDGELILIACNAGQSDSFLQAIANALRVRVRGYSTGIEWNLEYKGDFPHRAISRRGLTNPAGVFASGKLFKPAAIASQGK